MCMYRIYIYIYIYTFFNIYIYTYLYVFELYLVWCWVPDMLFRQLGNSRWKRSPWSAMSETITLKYTDFGRCHFWTLFPPASLYSRVVPFHIISPYWPMVSYGILWWLYVSLGFWVLDLPSVRGLALWVVKAAEQPVPKPSVTASIALHACLRLPSLRRMVKLILCLWLWLCLFKVFTWETQLDWYSVSINRKQIPGSSCFKVLNAQGTSVQWPCSTLLWLCFLCCPDDSGQTQLEVIQSQCCESMSIIGYD